MKLSTIFWNNRTELAVSTEKGMAPLSLMGNSDLLGYSESINSFLGNWENLKTLKTEINIRGPELKTLKEGEFRYAPAIGKPGKILCIGLNYKSHIEETNDKPPEFPVIFSKFTNSIAGHEEDIPLPVNSNQVDYEGELGLIIGKEAYMVPENQALGHVFGYFVGNDVSARDLQRKTSQWLLGKTCEKFFPTGPCIVTADEIPEPQKLSIKTTVNGEIRQNSNTSNMIFSCKNLISYISQYMKLEPGDVISTGTPDGVIAGFPEEKRVWLSDGDVVEVEIEKIGKIRNRFVK
ncbi:fumarylacetoacetate hydrolase family protein [Oxyplasma meridianum]|uniref:Fumarylacetoacetate hydrolase family protein n=1 Tax=Oxyplasma meridianum TaxID=3073602 RepID=A0AAX4NFW5_9ARCH